MNIGANKPVLPIIWAIAASSFKHPMARPATWAVRNPGFFLQGPPLRRASASVRLGDRRKGPKH